MTVVFDFDNTLFETEALKKVLFAIGEEHGFSPEKSHAIYEEARALDGQATFSIQMFCDVLQEKQQVSGDEQASVSPVLVRERIFHDVKLVAGARELLVELQARGVSLFLLSLGVPEWQKEKVDIAGIEQFFNDQNIIYTTDIHKGKIDMLREQFGDEFTGKDVIIFNDKPDETREMLQEFPELRAYLRRDEADERYTEQDFESVVQEAEGRATWEADLIKGKEFIPLPERYDGKRR